MRKDYENDNSNSINIVKDWESVMIKIMRMIIIKVIMLFMVIN